MYEYQALQSDTPPSPEQLNELNEQGGWRLVEFLVIQGKIYTFLEREKPAS